MIGAIEQWVGKFFARRPSPQVDSSFLESRLTKSWPQPAFDAMEARKLTDARKGPSKAEEDAAYLAACMKKVREVAYHGNNMAFFAAGSFKDAGGIKYFESRGYKVYFVNGGDYDSDDYRVEW
jgi:hypothetical protein